MALLYWYILPIGLELGWDRFLLLNFSQLVSIIEFSMTIKPRSDSEIQRLHEDIKIFLHSFENLYVQNDFSKVSRCRLCVFQLIHIPDHIRWFGSIRLGSRATVERMIGELGHQIRSKKAPFANMATILFERQVTHLLYQYYPDLQSTQQSTHTDLLFSKQNIKKREREVTQVFVQHLTAILLRDQIDFDIKFAIERFGKFSLSDGTVLHSRLVEQQKEHHTRCHRWFEAHEGDQIIFGEALAFYNTGGLKTPVVVCYSLHSIESQLGTLRGKWSSELQVLPLSSIKAIVGIWEYKGEGSTHNIYILRKHPGLEWLTPEERNLQETYEEEDED